MTNGKFLKYAQLMVNEIKNYIIRRNKYNSNHCEHLNIVF